MLEMIAANRPLADVLGWPWSSWPNKSFPMPARSPAAVLTSGRLEQVAPDLPEEFRPPC